MQSAPKGPFPFKGKGEDHWNIRSLRNRVELLQNDRAFILKQMQSLINEYDTTFSNQLDAYLVFHKTGNGNYLRWRMSGVKQRYFGISGDEIGESFLTSNSPTVQKVLLDYERNRLKLNLSHGLCFYEIKSLNRLISGFKEISRMKSVCH